MSFPRHALWLLLFSACSSSAPASPSSTSPVRNAPLDATSAAPAAEGAAVPEDATPSTPGAGDDAEAEASSAGDDAADANTTGDGAVALTFDFDACSPPPPIGDFPMDVGAVLRGKCWACHGRPQRHGAPFQLVDFENVVVQLPGGTIPIWQRMSYVIQPGAMPHMPLSGPQLTDAELQTLDDWFAHCAPPVPDGTGADLDPPATDGGADAGAD